MESTIDKAGAPMKNTWKLKRYLLSNDLKYLTLMVILYVGILSILIFPISMEENAMAWFGGYFACPVICIFLTRTFVLAVRRVNRSFAALEAEQMLEKVLKDFSLAEKAMGGNLYIGSLGLYGKGAQAVVLYRDMKKLYSVLSDRRGQNPRDLRFVDKDDTDSFICQLDPIGQSNTEIEQLYRLVRKKNPGVLAGE